MTRDEKINQRIRQLIDQGVKPERAVALAVAEQTLKDIESEQQTEKRQADLEKVISEGNRVVGDLRKLHNEMESADEN